MSDPSEPALLSNPAAGCRGHWEGVWCGLWAPSVLCEDCGGEDPPKVWLIHTPETEQFILVKVKVDSTQWQYATTSLAFKTLLK